MTAEINKAVERLTPAQRKAVIDDLTERALLRFANVRKDWSRANLASTPTDEDLFDEAETAGLANVGLLDVMVLLGSIATLTRERDEALEAKAILQQAVLERVKERDEARNALEPFAKIGARYQAGGLKADLEQRSPDIFRLLHACDFHQAHATLSRQSKEGGE